MTQNPSLEDIDLHFIDRDIPMLVAWHDALRDVPRAHVDQGNPVHRTVSAIVSPANSFGYMDGGFDGVLTERFGWGLEERVRATLLAEHDGELPIGQALVVPTEDTDIPWLVFAPTMRVPQDVRHTVNAFLAMRAILRSVRQHNQVCSAPEAITSLACTGLGTGTGGMPPERCARQMRHAYDVVARGELLTKGGLAGASRNHIWLVDADVDV